MNRYRRALTIAGSDSGGGAGIQADLKTFAACGCYGMSVVTALTAQNTLGVRGIHAVPPDFVAQQIDAVLEDIGVDAVKIGMLHSAEVIATVADRLRHHGVERIVVDPVMVATSGDRLLETAAVDALRTELLPLATIITPNAPEAAVLLDRDAVDSEAAAEDAARSLLALGPRAVLVKGGHLDGDAAVDVLATADTVWTFEAPRVETPNTHGTGCTLSSAICASLAAGWDIEQCIRIAKGYLTEAIVAGAGYTLGRGHGPVHHFHALWGPP
jgi:hydroxymethylpyrimidine/phosphomethylpyrimidine kinase